MLAEDDDIDIKYDPTENDMLSSPLSPAPSSPTPSSATAVPDDNDDVLPVLLAPECRMERKRSVPADDAEPRAAKKAKRVHSTVSRTPSPLPLQEEHDEDEDGEVVSPRRRKPRSSGGRSKTKRKPRTN